MINPSQSDVCGLAHRARAARRQIRLLVQTIATITVTNYHFFIILYLTLVFVFTVLHCLPLIDGRSVGGPSSSFDYPPLRPSFPPRYHQRAEAIG